MTGKKNMENKVLTLIKAYEKSMSGNDVDYTITDEIPAREATLYLFEGGGAKAAAVGYEGGPLFVMRDWQEPSRPTSADEIEDYAWVRTDGKEAINFLGLPRCLE